MKQWFNSLTPQIKGIITVVVLAILSVVAYISVKAILKAIEKAKNKKDPKVVVKESKQEYDDAIAAGESLSKPDSDHTSTANTIQKLLDGCETADSEEEVVRNVIKVVKKPIDWAYLKTKFDVREIDNCGPWTGSEQYDLPTLLKDQLDTAGWYSVDIDGYKKSGLYNASINVLTEYFKTIGITI